MIFTLTLNPAIDYFMSFENSIAGVQKTSKVEYLSGGKGINASKMLNNLKVPNRAVIVSGGINGKKLTTLLNAQNISYMNVQTNVETRINVKANFDGKTFEQNATGERVDGKEINQKLFALFKNLKPQDVVMIMGSLPTGYSFKKLHELVQYLFAKKIKLVFDLAKNHLQKLVKYQPEIIKPNSKELAEMFKVNIPTKAAALVYAKLLYQKGAKRVLVSYDLEGSIYYDGHISAIISGIKIREVNGSGAGDAMLATFTAFLMKNKNIVDTLKIATGAGTATAASQGIASWQKINLYKNKVEIKIKEEDNE